MCEYKYIWENDLIFSTDSHSTLLLFQLASKWKIHVQCKTLIKHTYFKYNNGFEHENLFQTVEIEPLFINGPFSNSHRTDNMNLYKILNIATKINCFTKIF